ncbi:CueP family metal-binding protein [Leucobacter tenebrionis]|uniref:CueP family metal-binding protein n=1 Tax=Leucobacter tenebrionis TaxID=2873270 RepID=UPI001CA64AF0|nr:CueP family metal-binding protein [Leucobacter tenebrionis]QZY50602.1 CueP family metal-binding protein [Leucobacter tenebrionis]
MRTIARPLSAALATLSAIALLTACTQVGTAAPGRPGSDVTSSGGSGSSGSEASASWLEEYDLDGLDAREIIERLDTMPVAERPAGLIASVQPDTLLLTDTAENETVFEMPEDEFYVSFAPYVDQTHDCYFHSLTTCLGELSGEDIEITVTDEADGSVILDESRQTYDNGFAGVWLPRGIDATLTVERDGRTATAQLSTGGEDPTCLTTLELA